MSAVVFHGRGSGKLAQANRGHAFDLNAIQGLIADPDLNTWLEEMQKLALVPVPR